MIIINCKGCWKGRHFYMRTLFFFCQLMSSAPAANLGACQHPQSRNCSQMHILTRGSWMCGMPVRVYKASRPTLKFKPLPISVIANLQGWIQNFHLGGGGGAKDNVRARISRARRPLRQGSRARLKGEVQSRITIISKESITISLQIGAKIMKIG